MKQWIKPYLILILLGSSLLGATPVLGQSPAYRAVLYGLYDSEFPVMTPEQITDLSRYQVLDTREKNEFEVSHLSGAKWVGFDTFSLKEVENLDKNQPILVYCTVGARSQEIGKKLQEAGFSRVYNLYGGIIQWVNDGRTVVANEKPTLRVHTYSRAWGIWLDRGEKVY